MPKRGHSFSMIIWVFYRPFCIIFLRISTFFGCKCSLKGGDETAASYAVLILSIISFENAGCGYALENCGFWTALTSEHHLNFTANCNAKWTSSESTEVVATLFSTFGWDLRPVVRHRDWPLCRRSGRQATRNVLTMKTSSNKGSMPKSSQIGESAFARAAWGWGEMQTLLKEKHAMKMDISLTWESVAQAMEKLKTSGNWKHLQHVWRKVTLTLNPASWFESKSFCRW
jgi:hypothetical protein